MGSFDPSRSVRKVSISPEDGGSKGIEASRDRPEGETPSSNMPPPPLHSPRARTTRRGGPRTPQPHPPRIAGSSSAHGPRSGPVADADPDATRRSESSKRVDDATSASSQAPCSLHAPRIPDREAPRCCRRCTTWPAGSSRNCCCDATVHCGLWPASSPPWPHAPGSPTTKELRLPLPKTSTGSTPIRNGRNRRSCRLPRPNTEGN